MFMLMLFTLMHANVDFDAHLEAVLLLGMVAGWAFLFVVWLAASWKQMPKLARAALWLGFGGTVLYVCLLYGFAWKSKEKTLARGVEKYFCELDCHLAYSVQGVEKLSTWKAEGSSAPIERVWDVALRTRFDETTISPRRPKDATLTPNPRAIELVSSDGRVFSLIGTQGAGLMQPLQPGESYVTHLLFQVPPEVKAPRLLLREQMWVSHVGIGSENSPGHRKTYFALE
jgi:hypothetical protein